MRVAVLGAAGTIAPAIVRDLAASEEVESILLLDLRAEQARLVAEVHGLGKATTRGADARSNLAAELTRQGHPVPDRTSTQGRACERTQGASRCAAGVR